MGWLSLSIWIPILAGVACVFIPRRFRMLFRLVALAAVTLSYLIILLLFINYDRTSGALQFVEQHWWITAGGSQYFLGIDVWNLALLVLTGTAGFCAVCFSRLIEHREKEYYMLLLWLYAGALGAFASQDLLLSFAFHELGLMPTFLGLCLWYSGPEEHRDRTAYLTAISLGLGSMLMLIALLFISVSAGGFTSNFVTLSSIRPVLGVAPEQQKLVYGFLMFGCLLLAGLWPFHSWVVAAYPTAPIGMVVMHAGSLKMWALYMLARVGMVLLPDGNSSWQAALLVFGLASLWYCGLRALVVRRLNVLLAYAAIAHAGFAVLALVCAGRSAGLEAMWLLLVAYGLFGIGAFGLAEYIRQKRGGVSMAEMSGVLAEMPTAGWLLLVFFFAGIGLPGFATFVGEVRVLAQLWSHNFILAFLALIGSMLLSAGYFMRAARLVLFGSGRRGRQAYDVDIINVWHRFGYVLPAVLLLLTGLRPALVNSPDLHMPQRQTVSEELQAAASDAAASRSFEMAAARGKEPFDRK